MVPTNRTKIVSKWESCPNKGTPLAPLGHFAINIVFFGAYQATGVWARSHGFVNAELISLVHIRHVLPRIQWRTPLNHLRTVGRGCWKSHAILTTCWNKIYYKLPWEPTTFIFRDYKPYIGGLKPSFFMVLGSKGIVFLYRSYITRRVFSTSFGTSWLKHD